MDEVSEDEDDALTVKQLMNRLVQARLPDSVTADNTSRFPKLFVDNLIVEQNRTEQDLKESIERWFGIEDEPEVQLAELENALQESTQAEQEVAEIVPALMKTKSLLLPSKFHQILLWTKQNSL